tara:strand:- start:247 stop:1206 length:960 start_codon:yes stop_codon:yes gene_type:complete
MRVAVAGVNGIGKHHAKWYHLADAEVVAFLGSSKSSCVMGAEALRAIFPFDGRSYSNFDALLEHERPDVVDICMPNELHFAYVKKALEYGSHVLCEKPLVWEEHSDPEELVRKAHELVDIAHARDLHLGMCSQYAAALPHYERVHERSRGAVESPSSFFVEMETLARGRHRRPEEIWVDMGSHPLSLLLAWMPNGSVCIETLEVSFVGQEARACFDFRIRDQVRTCRCEIIVRDVLEGQPIRRFGINGFIVDCEGKADETGAYRCVLSSEAIEDVGEDFMSLHIAQFMSCVKTPTLAPLVSGEIGARNLELQLQILQHV